MGSTIFMRKGSGIRLVIDRLPRSMRSHCCAIGTGCDSDACLKNTGQMGLIAEPRSRSDLYQRFPLPQSPLRRLNTTIDEIGMWGEASHVLERANEVVAREPRFSREIHQRQIFGVAEGKEILDAGYSSPFMTDRCWDCMCMSHETVAVGTDQQFVCSKRIASLFHRVVGRSEERNTLWIVNHRIGEKRLARDAAPRDLSRDACEQGDGRIRDTVTVA